jgi:hypothetical protein
MRQQLRLRVLLPLAVLGLLGAGFGAYAFGQAPEPAATPPPPTTTAGAKPAAKKAGSAVDAAVWAKQVNALCVQTEAAVGELPEPGTPRQVLAYLRAALKAERASVSSLVSLGWPRGGKGAVLGLRALAARNVGLLQSAVAELAANDLQGFRTVVERGAALDARWNAEVRRLGVRECVRESAAAAARKASKSAALEWALVEESALVVLFYTPASGLDGTTVLEARSAALSVGAGFLAVNVKRNDAVAELAEEYEVVEAPVVLVFVRGPKLAARFDRFADRETIAQAVENALR